jgi:TonB-dependent SusC/RagA subfamily outer membrane receptor
MKAYKFFLVILILSLSAGSFAQTSGKKYFITGQVFDSNNRPVVGASLLVDSKSTNVVTDANGNYKVKVKPDAGVLSVFSISNGLLINEEIKGREVINFKFEAIVDQQEARPKASVGSEEVNIGYGTAQKKDLSTNIATVEGKKSRYSAYQNIYDLIRGEVPNVQISGDKIILKGAYDTNSGQIDALILVDGVEAPLSGIVPRMVKSISVLTGADASIYGARSAHGVILITLTKD